MSNEICSNRDAIQRNFDFIFFISPLSVFFFLFFSFLVRDEMCHLFFSRTFPYKKEELGSKDWDEKERRERPIEIM